ncbi:MAG: Na+/H+ antiporter subunit E [Candidatus Promineifilaceae bacterium]|nr:Na+/H+ antiporter subunit E [Candidatus Promineifilaceae bacterium]
MNRIRGMLGLTAVYLALTGNFQLSNIVAGLIISTFVVWLLRMENKPLSLRAFFPAAWALVKYIVVLMIDLVISGLQVARIVLSPKLPIAPGNIAIPTRCSTDLAQALSAHAITLTPGEMVVEMGERGVMYTHALDATDADEYVAQAQEKREQMLIKIMP